MCAGHSLPVRLDNCSLMNDWYEHPTSDRDGTCSGRAVLDQQDGVASYTGPLSCHRPDSNRCFRWDNQEVLAQVVRTDTVRGADRACGNASLDGLTGRRKLRSNCPAHYYCRYLHYQQLRRRRVRREEGEPCAGRRMDNTSTYYNQYNEAK
jgi:hypothetical protein